jgi:glucose/arabinose dehydrogenase
MTSTRFVVSRRDSPAKRTARRILASASLLIFFAPAPRILLGQTTQPAFRDRAVFSGLTAPTAVAFSPDGRVFVAEKRGTIKVFSDLSDTTPTVFTDLHLNVYNSWDRGLLGLALHPDFPATPYVYVLYAYDAAIGGTAPRWGPGDNNTDPCPDPPGFTNDGCVVSGRLSRLTASGDVMSGSEQVLIEDWFQQYPSHSIGSLVFGPDGMLYATGGDGASFNFADYGQDGNPRNPGGDPPVPVGGVQTPPTAEGGALRSQDLRTTTGTDPVTLDGTLIRIDPLTGAGLSGNPLFSSPDPNAKRVVAYGLRNPFRMTVRPGTSEIWIGDVGWSTWEEINRVQTTTSLTNFGWPCYEGAGRMSSYDNLNLNICENLYAETGAVRSPYYTYNHAARVVSGESCPTGSSSITGLAFYTGTTYPASYRNALFFSDYSRRCIWAMLPDGAGNPNPSNIQTFVAGAASPVQLTIGPGGDLFYVDINGGTIRRIQFDVPLAAISASPTSGTAPLLVDFSGAGSTHPNPLETLSYSWDLNGDGTFGDATTVQTSYTFTGVGSHTVTLRVSDTHGGVDTETVVISVDNAPPVPVIASPLPTLTWKVGDAVLFAGSATDPQDGDLPASALTWSLVLHHCPSNCHEHPLTVLGSSFTTPDHEYPSHLELKLTARDSAGLEATTSVLLYPQSVTLTFATSPTGLQLSHNATSGPSPLTSDVIVGSQNSISAPSPQTLGGSAYEFVSWSDGGAENHNFTAPAAASTYTATFALRPPPSSLSANPATVAGGASSTGTVVLSGPAPGSGAIVALSSGNPAVASVPESVTVAAGATSADFAITTFAVSGDTPVSLSASYGGGSAGTTVTVTPAPNVPPTVAISSPSSGATYVAPATVVIDADASDPDGGTVVRVDFYEGSNLLGTDSTAPFSWTWSGVGIGSYSLTAVAVDDRSGTTSSAPVPITVNGSGLPSPWTQGDVGATGLAGSGTFSGGLYTVVGSGQNIAGTADAFHYVYQPMSGDGQIVARITGVQNTNNNSKGGVMIRESLTANSANVAMVLTGGNRFQFQVRASTGATTSNWSGTQAPPHWVKLVRSGNTFTAYRSSNGVTWTLYAASPVNVPMPANVYVGLVMTSNNNSVLGTATMDNVGVVSGPPNASPSASITSPVDGTAFTDPASISIEASASDSDGTVSRVDFYDGATLLGSDASAPYAYSWSSPPAGSHSLTARAVDNLNATTTSIAVSISVSYTPTSQLPAPWVNQDVGAVGVAGSATYGAGEFQVTGSGTNIAGTADAFHYVYQAMSGDGEIVARITGVQNVTNNSKGGIMVRESLAANSANVAMVITGGNRFQFQVRASTGGTTSIWSGNQTPPHWVRLVRSGNTFTAYRSSNGLNWTLYGASPVTVPMGSNVYVGLVMTSNSNSVSGTATLDGVTATP